MLGRLGAATDAVKEGNSLNRNLIAFGDGIGALERDGQRIALCLDEFENTFKHPAEFGDDFFDHLRSLVNVRRFALVTASRQTLQALSLAGDITNVGIIAVNLSIRDRRQLWRWYGKGCWRKLKGEAMVRLPSGNMRYAEIHWYEAHGIGRREFKVTKFLD